MKKSVKVGFVLLGALGFSALLASQAQSGKVSITYWQYVFDSKVKIMDSIMADFNKANPDIEVKQENFPYDGYIQKVESSLAAGQGPDVVNLFYGWVPQFAGNGLIPLPESDFSAKSLESNVGPLIKASKVKGKYWAVPTAVRTLAVFYNKDLFKAAGIAKLPKTWAELSSAAQKIQKSDGGKIQVAGLALAPQGQDHICSARFWCVNGVLSRTRRITKKSLTIPRLDSRHGSFISAWCLRARRLEGWICSQPRPTLTEMRSLPGGQA
jgi:ABC-type glycerol-3-phosphate transport system substrate-binding protein